MEANAGVTPTATTPARGGGFGLPALGGLAYVVLFIVSFAVASGGQPNGDAPPAKVIAYYSDSGHRNKAYLGFVILVIAVFCLIWFLGALRRLLLQIDPTGQLSWVASIGGTVYAATTLVAFALEDSIYSMSDDTYNHQVYPSLIHAAGDAGYGIHAAGGAGMAALMIAASLAVMRAGLVGRGLAIVGVVLGVLAIFSGFFFPMIGIALWLIVASIALFRTPAVVSARGVPGL